MSMHFKGEMVETEASTWLPLCGHGGSLSTPQKDNRTPLQDMELQTKQPVVIFHRLDRSPLSINTTIGKAKIKT